MTYGFDPSIFRRRDVFSGYVTVRLDAALTRPDHYRLADVARSMSLNPLAEALRAHDVADGARLFRAMNADAVLKLERAATRGVLPPLNSLAQYWRLDLRDTPERVPALVERLLATPGVDHAYPDTVVDLPAPPTPGDEPLFAQQGYLKSAPKGINAEWAWTRGDGAGVGVVDVEAGWNVAHEELAAKPPQLIAGVNHTPGLGFPVPGDPGTEDWLHGTAVLSVLTGADNGRGIMGIAPGAPPVRVASVWNGAEPGHVVEAVTQAITNLSAGDVMVLELQTARGQITGWPDRHPVEIKDEVLDVIRLAINSGIVVIEAAGNGRVRLDDYVAPQGRDQGKHVLDRNSADFRESGAIMVGAATAADPHRRWSAVVGGRQVGSNFGSRLDCYAWGENVVSAGRNGLTPGEADPNRWYMGDFGATSGATAILAGAAVLLQAMHKAKMGVPLTPLEMRATLADPARGTATDPAGPGEIGAMPDLRKQAMALKLVPKPSRKVKVKRRRKPPPRPQLPKPRPRPPRPPRPRNARVKSARAKKSRLKRAARGHALGRRGRR